MDSSRVTNNVSVDVISGDDQLRRHPHHHRQQRQQQQQQGGRYYYTSTLTVRSSSTSDAGVYVCSAANSRGVVERRTFLHVIPTGQPVLELLFTAFDSISLGFLMVLPGEVLII